MVKRVIPITLAFIGLLVGAGFATGQEAIQFFVAFGKWGVAGAALAGVIIALGGMVSLKLGSFFLADEHNEVFQDITRTSIVARFLDIAVVITLFALGFVMLAGAGSTLEQQFGLSPWVGSTIMLVLVLVSGFFDVEKVSKVIGMITPAMILAVFVAFGYVMLHLPSDFAAVNEIATSQQAAITPWWLAAINYAGLVEIMAVSMVLVIGGSYFNPRESAIGGLIGGLCYTLLLIMICVTLFFASETVANSDVPNLVLFESIHPTLAIIAVLIVYAMIYNTCIGMFYALGRRLSAGKQQKFRVYFFATTILGYVISFVGFGSLMSKVYPALGYLGLALTAILLAYYVRGRSHIDRETSIRNRLRTLAYRRHHPEKKFTAKDQRTLDKLVDESHIDNDAIEETVTEEVVEELVADDSVDFDEQDAEAILGTGDDDETATSTGASTGATDKQ